MQLSLDSLRQVPGVESVSPFHFVDGQGKQTQCGLLVNSGAQWVMATDWPGQVSLVQCTHSLAESVCNRFELDPGRVVLLTCYAYAGQLNLYSLHFRAGARDLFQQVRFIGGERRAIHPADVLALLRQLANGGRISSQYHAVLGGNS